LICLGLILCGSAIAVDKTIKVDKALKKVVPASDTANRVKKIKPQDSDKADQSKSPKSYDKFIDLNSNGIDDRLEKGQSSLKQRPKADSTHTNTPPEKP